MRLNHRAVTKTAIPFTEAKPRRASRWALLHLPLILAVIVITLTSLSLIANTLTYSERTEFLANDSSNSTIALALTPRVLKRLNHHVGSAPISPTIPVLFSDILQDASGTLSLHIANNSVTHVSYRSRSTGEFIVLGDATQLARVRKAVLFPTLTYREGAAKRSRARITRKYFEVSIASEPFVESDLLLPEGATVTAIYNQERGLIQDPLASSRIVLGNYQQEPFLHLSYRSNPSVTISDLEILVDHLNHSRELSTQVLTEGYHFRTNVISSVEPIITESTGDESFASVYSTPQELNFHATKSLDRVIITNLPTNQDLYTVPLPTSTCLPRAHSFNNNPLPSLYLFERLLVHAHQSKHVIRSCF